MVFDNPVFAILLIFVAFEIGYWLSKKINHILANALVLADLIVILFLLIAKIPYKSFFKGGQLIQFMLGPATVALVIPLYRQWNVLKKNWIAVFGGVIVGSGVSIFSVLIAGKIFSLDYVAIVSMLPKSVTAPIGIEVSAEYGGVVILSIMAILITGSVGVMFGPIFLKKLKIIDPVAVGVALGTTSHFFGATKAMEYGETEGAMAGLCIGLAGIMTVILMPFAVLLL